jgi:hypothetical protein
MGQTLAGKRGNEVRTPFKRSFLRRLREMSKFFYWDGRTRDLFQSEKAWTLVFWQIREEKRPGGALGPWMESSRN